MHIGGLSTPWTIYWNHLIVAFFLKLLFLTEGGNVPSYFIDNKSGLLYSLGRLLEYLQIVLINLIYQCLIRTTFEQVNKVLLIGGKNDKDIVKRALTIIFTDNLACICSWTGQKNNFKVGDTYTMMAVKSKLLFNIIS